MIDSVHWFIFVDPIKHGSWTAWSTIQHFSKPSFISCLSLSRIFRFYSNRFSQVCDMTWIIHHSKQLLNFLHSRFIHIVNTTTTKIQQEDDTTASVSGSATSDQNVHVLVTDIEMHLMTRWQRNKIWKWSTIEAAPHHDIQAPVTYHPSFNHKLSTPAQSTIPFLLSTILDTSIWPLLSITFLFNVNDAISSRVLY